MKKIIFSVILGYFVWLVLLLSVACASTLDRDTDILFTSKYCGPCIKAKVIIEQMIEENYDVIIADIHTEVALKNQYSIQGVPTLVVRTRGMEVGRYSNIYDAGRYRQLIEKKNPYTPLFGDIKVRENYTGTLRFVSEGVEINAPGYKQIPIEKYPELVERFKVSGPCVLILVHGKVITRT
jgi:thiol-disulfide isomerase/thioredoxin